MRRSVLTERACCLILLLIHLLFSYSFTNISPPFENTIIISEDCDAALQFLHQDGDKTPLYYVIITTRNDIPSALLHTINSLISASSGDIAEIIIVDDYSDTPVSKLDVWLNLSDKVPVTFTRLNEKKGGTFAKNFGSNIAKKNCADRIDQNIKCYLLFFDSIAFVAKDRLKPLTNTLQKYEHAIVYPSIDFVTLPATVHNDNFMEEFNLIKSEDTMVAAFDWSLHPSWEKYGDVPAGSSSNPRIFPQVDRHAAEHRSSELLSPALPSIFAVDLHYFLDDLNGFDEIILTSASSNHSLGHENIELSLRVWLCGGVIIKQMCSRVARYAPNVVINGNGWTIGSTAVGDGITQAVTDQNVINIAHKWLKPSLTSSMDEKSAFGTVDFKEIVYQSRFIDRVPYMVEISTDLMKTTPKANSKILKSHVLSSDAQMDSTQLQCLTFEWYLQEIFPGLLSEIRRIQSQYRVHLASDHLEMGLKSLLDNYRIASKVLEVDPKEIEALKIRKEKLLTSRQNYKKLSFQEPAGHVGQTAARNVKVVKNVQIPNNFKQDKYDIHAEKVRTELLCEDIEVESDETNCGKLAATNNGCVNNKAEMLFLCPKTCGFCENGKFCEDFFLNKCIDWGNDGLCTDPSFVSKCMKTCEKCKPEYVYVMTQQTKPAVKEVAITPVDAKVAQKDLASGKIVEKYDAEKSCNLANLADAKLLSRVKIAAQNKTAAGVRIFCGIYTMEQNHQTRVKATRNTWAKKCDGFVAFSTKEDLAIPAIKIEHEGKEDYNNMWQKSKSIWKYIAEHFIDDYDFFLLGGDDMFYIIENLRHYLNSEEIKNARNDRAGLYLGRVFQPPNQIVFNSGGAGYLLDSKALKVLQQNIDTSKCYPHQEGFWEDVNVANCLKKSDEHIVPYDTRDPLERERFHPFNPGNHLTYRIPPINPDWYAKYNPNLKIGFDCCSEFSVSFHYIHDSLMYNIYNFIYFCSNKESFV